jgi:DNA-binding Lrp family transcriptional regulator
MSLAYKYSDVLAAIVATNSLSIDPIARLTGLRPHTVRRQLNRLIEDKVVFKSILFNPSLLGLQWINIFFSLPVSKKQATLSFLRGQPTISFLAENSGDSPYEMTCLVRHIGEVEDLLRQVSDRFDVHLDRTALTAETELTFIGYKYLAKENPIRNPIAIACSNERQVCDPEELKLLALLQSCKCKNEAEMARVLKIPQSTLAYRMKVLHEKKVIAADLIYINTTPLGLLHVQILVRFKTMKTEQVKAFYAQVKRSPFVVAIIRGLGFWDFKLIVQSETYEQLFDLQDSLRLSFPDLIRSLNVIPRRSIFQIAPIFEFPLNPGV